MTAAGGAPAVITCTPRGACFLSSAGALARAMSTVGAAHRRVTRSTAMSGKATAGSTARRQIWRAPAAVIVHVNVHPLAWNIGSVHK